MQVVRRERSIVQISAFSGGILTSRFVNDGSIHGVTRNQVVYQLVVALLNDPIAFTQFVEYFSRPTKDLVLCLFFAVPPVDQIESNRDKKSQNNQWYSNFGSHFLIINSYP